MDLLTTSMENAKSIVSLTQMVNALAEDNRTLYGHVSDLKNNDDQKKKDIAEVRNQLAGFKMGCEAMFAPVIKAIMQQKKELA